MGAQETTAIPSGAAIGGTGGLEGQREKSETVPSVTPKRVGATRASRAWVKVLPALFVLAVILLFIFQNSHSVKVSFATASGRLPLAVALLAAAALGGVLVLALGSIRILQLRRLIHRSRRSDAHRRVNGPL
jgi:uncharacterized integral membrane protein